MDSVSVFSLSLQKVMFLYLSFSVKRMTDLFLSIENGREGTVGAKGCE